MNFGDGKRLTIQNTPAMAPSTMAKMTVKGYEVAGTQSAQTAIQQAKVVNPATSILPYRSLSRPTHGLPINVPKFKNAVTEEAFD
jgi:hypothetical protein